MQLLLMQLIVAILKRRLRATAQACHCSAGPEDTLDVSCKAKNCVFNDNSKCHADKITISGNGAKHESQTECGSFECGCK